MEKWNRNRRALGLAVDEQPGDRIELVAEIDADRADRRQVAQARTDVVAQVVQVEVPRVVPDVAGVGEQRPRSGCPRSARAARPSSRTSCGRRSACRRRAATPRTGPSRAGSSRRRASSAGRTAPSGSSPLGAPIEPPRALTATTARSAERLVSSAPRESSRRSRSRPAASLPACSSGRRACSRASRSTVLSAVLRCKSRSTDDSRPLRRARSADRARARSAVLMNSGVCSASSDTW